MLYRVPLGYVNVLINMPDEAVEDIIESTENLHFMRFFLSKMDFIHNLIPVIINSTSRYYRKIEHEKKLWTKSTSIANELLKKIIHEDYHWDILEFAKRDRHYQWNIFKKIENYYIENRHTYSITKDENTIRYSEYLNGRYLFEIIMEKDSLHLKILHCANDYVVSLDILKSIINDETEMVNHYSIENIIQSIDDLFKKGLIYHSSDYSEIVSLINIDI
jgi:hypothetical protein